MANHPSTFDPQTNTKRCPQCKERKDLSLYHANKRTKDGHTSWCKVCSAARGRRFLLENPGRGMSYTRMYRYKMPEEKYQTLFTEQNGLCAICGQPPKPNRSLCVDHNHTCCPTDKTCGYCSRGLLCDSCNHLLGMAEDDVRVLTNAIDYLNRYKQ